MKVPLTSKLTTYFFEQLYFAFLICTWALRLMLTMLAMFTLTYFHWQYPDHGGGADKALSESSDSDIDDRLRALRGRKCWTYCCVIFVVVATFLIFELTLFVVADINHHINESGISMAPFVQVLPIIDAGSRAYVSSMSLVLSVFSACYYLSNWRAAGSPKTSGGLLVQMGFRGTSFAVFLAMFLELYFGGLLNRVTTQGMGLNYSTLMIMMMVGISEEAAKTGAVIVCTLFVPPPPDPEVESCHMLVTRMFRLLIDNSKALALCGMAVGFGFMTGENVGYVMSAATVPPVVDPQMEASEKEVRQATAAQGVVTLLVRVAFNIHPWLSGLSACRLGKFAFNADTGKAKLNWGSEVRVRSFLWCIWPAAAIHGLYDFAVSSNMGWLTLLSPLVFWIWSYTSFSKAWSELDHEDTECDEIKDAEKTVT